MRYAMAGIGCLLAFGGWALAAFTAPRNDATGIPYEGHLEQNGIVVDGSRDFEVSVYGQASGGSALYAETHSGVLIGLGHFHLIIGTGATTAGDFAALSSASELFVGFSVKTASDVSFTPLAGRQRLASVPYALRGAPGMGFVVDGNLGVGTTMPATRLDVAGRIRDQTGFVTPVGTVAAYYGNSAPPGWLLCQGQAVSGAQYGDLCTLIAGSAPPCNVPDLRGVFIRGAGTAVRGGVTYTAPALGQFQADALQDHSHGTPHIPKYGWNGVYADGGAPSDWHIKSPATDYLLSTGGVNSGRVDVNETRPANLALAYIIKY